MTRSTIALGDGAELSIITAGEGAPLVMLPGWSQTAAMFKHQIDSLSGKNQVIAIDLRGHGESSKTTTGYTIDQLTFDLRQVIERFELRDVTLLGHSMGNQIIWNYWRHFGDDRLRGMVIAEQPLSLVAGRDWSEEERQLAGAIFDSVEALEEQCQAIRGDDGAEVSRTMLAGLFNNDISEDQLDWVLSENLKLPRPQAADLLRAGGMSDWRELVPNISLPTLIIAGRASVVPWLSQEWMAQQIEGAQISIFEPEEGGHHFMFLANPEKFNSQVAAFLSR